MSSCQRMVTKNNSVGALPHSHPPPMGTQTDSAVPGLELAVCIQSPLRDCRL